MELEVNLIKYIMNYIDDEDYYQAMGEQQENDLQAQMEQFEQQQEYDEDYYQTLAEQQENDLQPQIEQYEHELEGHIEHFEQQQEEYQALGEQKNMIFKH
jgi:multidrug resistance efflux pump